MTPAHANSSSTEGLCTYFMQLELKRFLDDLTEFKFDNKVEWIVNLSHNWLEEYITVSTLEPRVITSHQFLSDPFYKN